MLRCPLIMILADLSTLTLPRASSPCTCPLQGTVQCRVRALHYKVYCSSTASFSRRYQTFAKLPSSKVNSGWTWTRSIWIFCLSIIQFSEDYPSFKTSLYKTFSRKLNSWRWAASLEMKCDVLCDICHQIVSIIVWLSSLSGLGSVVSPGTLTSNFAELMNNW